MRLREILSPWHLAVLTLSLAACERGGAPAAGQKPRTDDSPVVAVIGERAITASEFQARLEEQPPFVRARYATLEKKKEYLDNLVRFELLAQEAWRRGLDKDPEVRAALEKVMVQKLLRSQSGEAAGGLPEADLRKYYEEHQDEFVKPERVRLSHIFLASPRADAKHPQVQASAAKLLAELKVQDVAGDKAAFEGNARNRSDDEATKASGGDLGYRSREELTLAWGPALADAAFGLKTIGDFGPVVATDKGFHLVKLTGRQVGLNLPFETARQRIESRLTMERRAKSLEELVASLRTGTSIQVKDDALEKIKVDGSDAAAAPATP
ncbi:peptidylprolyl isomerase [Myxococcaceae bacterium GXIMD 01537]